MNGGYHKSMKRAWITIAAVALLALPAWGQIHGVPASVTSMAPWRSFNPGPPASVTSLGPRGYSTPCSQIPSAVGCTFTHFNSQRPFFSDGHRGGQVNRRPGNTPRGFVPYYVPYAYPVVVGAEPDPQPLDATGQIEEEEPPAPTVFEHRSRSDYVTSAPASRYRPDPPTSEVAPAPPSPAEAREQIPIVLVYRDGRQQEVSNYAIIGQTLYDLGAFVAHKIPLADLNLKATIKANDDRGVEFAVPTSVKLD